MDMSDLVLRLERFPTACGTVLIVTDDQETLRAVDWEDHEPRMRRLLELHNGNVPVRLRPRSPDSGVCLALQDYFSGDLRAIDELRVRTEGTEFQRQVWKTLRTIPPGTTVTYGQLAARLRRPNAVRAVGTANGANPIPIVVPCHRVIGADGSLTGYGSGLERKRWLLEHEGVRLLARQCRGRSVIN
jgi:methylated-DNA-[protein]-cysteine S-methyltransferase